MAGKGELVERVASQTGLSKSQAAQAVEAVFDVISGALASGESVTISGFGSWKVSDTKERQGRNPATGAAITIPAGKRIGFHAGSRLTDSVRSNSIG